MYIKSISEDELRNIVAKPHLPSSTCKSLKCLQTRGNMFKADKRSNELSAAYTISLAGLLHFTASYQLVT